MKTNKSNGSLYSYFAISEAAMMQLWRSLEWRRRF